MNEDITRSFEQLRDCIPGIDADIKDVLGSLLVTEIDSKKDNVIITQTKRLESLLLQADNILKEMKSEFSNDSLVSTRKLRFWEKKLLDLSLNNELISMSSGKDVTRFECDDISLLEDELDMGKEYHIKNPSMVQIYRASRTNMEESGTCTLFLALGILKWVSADKVDRYSPILLIPMDIMPTQDEEEFIIKKRDEKVLLNVTLLEYLSQNVNITIDSLNPLPSDDHGVDVTLVMHTVETAISAQANWELLREARLGIFSFSKFVMWNDLHQNSGLLKQNPIVRSLLEGRLLLKDNVPASDARQLDKVCKPEDVAVPIDVDSSQLEAVVDCANGRSFLLYGPPGTGKSQTITNMIANALYHNKRILFVAQKKAALDVVRDRLGKIGIAPFCLELHSNKTDKKHFLEQMRNVIEVAEKHKEDPNLIEVSDRLFKSRNYLLSYIDSLHKVQPFGYSLHDCIERYLNTEGEEAYIDESFVTRHNKEAIEHLYNKCIGLENCAVTLGSHPKDFPLHDLRVKSSVLDTINTAKKYSFLNNTPLSEVIRDAAGVLEDILVRVENNKKITFMKRTPQQTFESDPKWKKLLEKVEFDTTLYDSPCELREIVNRWGKNTDLIDVWVEFLKGLQELRESGLVAPVDIFLDTFSGKKAAQAFIKGYYKAAALHIIGKDASLSKFNGTEFSKIIEDYNSLSDEYEKYIQKELYARLADRVPLDTSNEKISYELTLLRKRIGNNGKGTTVRSIILNMPNLISTLCPCLLMSPSSVAQFIDINASPFDIVIFDEASQIPTCEAIGALVRAKSFVIVGDPNQMPPTSFFSTKIPTEGEESIDDQESILDDCIALSVPSRYISWHYRSKHESLITFCNQNFYGGNLMTFPSVDNQVSHVSCKYVDGIYENSKNQIEAVAIVDEIIKHLKRKDGKSIGVIAFSRSQADEIENTLEKELKKYPELRTYDMSLPEPIFVKNLENVQGDERDIILFSIGYGPDSKGKIAQNFGPLRLSGGERRLNVAASRARYEMKVFSSIHPDQIDISRANFKGVPALRNFIAFAESGVMPMSKNSVGILDTMIQQIADRIKEAGYQVHTNVGTSSFKVDVAIVDPKCKSKYLLGIMCDGSRYYKLKTTRDREIVQSSVLESLGWKLLHVWTIDWLKHSDNVLTQIMNTLRENVKSANIIDGQAKN